MTGLFMLTVSSAFGQQTPSQRYQPAPLITNSSATPADSPQLRATNNRYGKAAQPQFEEPVMRGNIQKASFQTDANDEPVVPSILLGTPPSVQAPGNQLPVEAQEFRAPPVSDIYTRRSPNDFSASMSQVRGSGPRIAPQEIESQQQSISQQMAELRLRAEEKAKAEADRIAAEMAAEEEAKQRELARIEIERQNAAREAEKLAAAKAEIEAVKLAAETKRLAEQRAQAERQAAIEADQSCPANENRKTRSC